MRPISFLLVLVFLGPCLVNCEGVNETGSEKPNQDGGDDEASSENPNQEVGDDGHGEEGLGRHKKNVREKIILCHKPDFFDEVRCGTQLRNRMVKSFTPIADLIQLDISKMPFKADQWIHIDVAPTPEAISAGTTLKIKHALVQISDSQNRMLGRIAEQIPCEATGHPAYQEGKGTILELFQNPGMSEGSGIMECNEDDDLSYNMNPTVPILQFSPPVEAFYANFKFTWEETQMLQNDSSTDRVSVTTLLVDEDGNCYLHRLDQLDVLPAVKQEGTPEMKVPIPCHSAGPAFQDAKGVSSPLRMDPRLRINMSSLTFLQSPGARPNSRQVQLGNWEYRRKLLAYNNKQYKVDSQGYLPGEKEKEEKKLLHLKLSTFRRPSAPLIAGYVETPIEQREESISLADISPKLTPILNIFSRFIFPLIVLLLIEWT